MLTYDINTHVVKLDHADIQQAILMYVKSRGEGGDIEPSDIQLTPGASAKIEIIKSTEPKANGQ
jgi:hypothetical protein